MATVVTQALNTRTRFPGVGGCCCPLLSRHHSRQLGVAQHYGQGSKGSALVTARLGEELGRVVEAFLKGILRKGVPNDADAHSGTCVIK